MRHFILGFGCLLVLAGCSSNSTPPNTSQADTTNTHSKANLQPVHSKLNDAGTQTLMAVVHSYYTLKNALVAAKAPKADSAARELTMIADSLQVAIGKDSVNGAMLKPYVDTIIAQGKAISGVKDETCEKQRLAFGTLSGAMYGLLKKVELKNANIYHAYCPMAFNDKGAFWLSEELDIKNPYFGKKMLECGEVTDSL